MINVWGYRKYSRVQCTCNSIQIYSLAHFSRDTFSARARPHSPWTKIRTKMEMSPVITISVHFYCSTKSELVPGLIGTPYGKGRLEIIESTQY